MTAFSEDAAMRQMLGITRRLAGAKIEAVGYDEETGSVVIVLDTGERLLVSAGYGEGYHVICEPGPAAIDQK